ncbi:MAG TPA: hypothetical protein VGB85_27605, partial [Nannocystis sp.]
MLRHDARQWLPGVLGLGLMTAACGVLASACGDNGGSFGATEGDSLSGGAGASTGNGDDGGQQP